MSKSGKQATIASLVRASARSEKEFIEVVNDVFEEGDVERIAEYFDRLNIPRSQTSDEDLLGPLAELKPVCLTTWDFKVEKSIGAGMQKYLDRHIRKVKWHATHPSQEGISNVLLVNRGAMVITDLRLRRLLQLLKGTDELSVSDWAISRNLMNSSYLTFRKFLAITATDWADAIKSAVPPEEVLRDVGTFYELVDETIRKLEVHRDAIEERRAELTVIPEGYPPVKPPNYFGGDLLGRGPWKQFWLNIDAKAHRLRETINA